MDWQLVASYFTIFYSAAGCQSFYRKIYGHFYSVVFLLLSNCAFNG